MTFVRLVNTCSLPPGAMNRVSPSNAVILQVSQENNRDIQLIGALLLEQRAPTTHVKVESQFFQKFCKTMKRLEIVKGIFCGKYFDNTVEVVYQHAVVRQDCMKDIIRTLLEDIMLG